MPRPFRDDNALRVRAGRDRCPTAAIIDSQTVPAADTVPRSSRGGDGAKRTNGVKRHIAVDVNGLLLAVVVTAASIQDRDAAHRLLAALRGSFSTIRLVWADGGYPGRHCQLEQSEGDFRRFASAIHQVACDV